MSISNLFCQLHNSEALALNLSPNLQWQDSLLCIHCLTTNQDSNYVKTIEEVKDILERNKTHQKAAQMRNKELIISNLEQLRKYLTNLQRDFNVQIEVLINNISSQLLSHSQAFETSEQSMQEEVQKLITSTKYDDQWLQQIEQNLQALQQKTNIESCINLIYQLKQELTTSPFQILLKNTRPIKELKPHRTPKLDFLCQKHDKEIIMIDMGTNSEQKLCCVECMPQNFWSLSKVKEQWKIVEEQRKDFIASQINHKLQTIEQISVEIKPILEKLQKSPQTIFQLFLSSMDQIVNQFENLFTNMDWKQLSADQVIERADYLFNFQNKQIQLIKEEYQQLEDLQHQQIVSEFQTFKNLALDLFNKIKSVYRLPEVEKESILDIDMKTETIDKQQTKQIEIFMKDVDISAIHDNSYLKYELVNKYDQQEVCHAIAFNLDGTIMVNGCQDEIIVSEFKNGAVKECSVLKGHNNQIVSLCFGQDNDQFFSGSTDKSIINWQRQISNEWLCAQVLSGHKRLIDCILFNRKENQLISCSSDKSIRVWSKDQESKWQDSQILLYHKAYVRCISLNKSQTKLVSCSEDKSVIIWAIDASRQWKLNQIIQCDDYGYRISFINDSMIAWQTRNKGTMIVFEYVSETDTFKQANYDVQLNKNNDGYQNFFPSIYNDERKVLINKHGKYVYVIRILNEDKFTIDQVIDVGHYCNYGALTPDGNYLVIWDEGSKQMQVRKAN